jgi:hypothetical protein
MAIEGPTTTQVSTITARQVEKAYVYEDRRQQRRIEEHGKINRQVLRDLIRDPKTQ